MTTAAPTSIEKGSVQDLEILISVAEDYSLSRLLEEHVDPKVSELCDLIRAAMQPFDGPEVNSMYIRDDDGRFVLDTRV